MRPREWELGTFFAQANMAANLRPRAPKRKRLHCRLHPWSLSRVSERTLDPGKHCYVATKRLCGVRLNAFGKNEIFGRFPDEIRSVPPADLKPVNRACSFPTRQPNNLYVVSTFGLCAALLRPSIVLELFLLFQVTTTKAFFTSVIK